MVFIGFNALDRIFSVVLRHILVKKIFYQMKEKH